MYWALTSSLSFLSSFLGNREGGAGFRVQNAFSSYEKYFLWGRQYPNAVTTKIVWVMNEKVSKRRNALQKSFSFGNDDNIIAEMET